ncbi:hypothetical protein M8494_12735 [Serratia ureilytica]
MSSSFAASSSHISWLQHASRGHCSGWNSRKKTPSFARIFTRRRRSRFTGHVIPVKTYVENNIFNPTISLNILRAAFDGAINYIHSPCRRFFIHQRLIFEPKKMSLTFSHNMDYYL